MFAKHKRDAASLNSSIASPTHFKEVAAHPNHIKLTCRTAQPTMAPDIVRTTANARAHSQSHVLTFEKSSTIARQRRWEGVRRLMASSVSRRSCACDGTKKAFSPRASLAQGKTIKHRHTRPVYSRQMRRQNTHSTRAFNAGALAKNMGALNCRIFTPCTQKHATEPPSAAHTITRLYPMHVLGPELLVRHRACTATACEDTDPYRRDGCSMELRVRGYMRVCGVCVCVALVHAVPSTTRALVRARTHTTQAP